MKKCPFCAEEIQDEAIKCRYCSSPLGEAGAVAVTTPGTSAGGQQHAQPAPLGATTTAPEEKTYLSDSLVRITSTRAVVGGKTYAMANITSVSLITTDQRGMRAWGLLLLVLGILLTLTGAGAIIGIPLAIVSIFMLRAKPTYTVRLGSSSGEADALTDRNKAYIEQIVRAANEAIVERG